MPFPEAVRSVPAIRAASDPDAAKLLEMLKRADATFERACPSARLKSRSMHSNVCCGYSHGRPTPTHACPGGMTQRLVVQNDVEERVVGGHCVARPDIVLTQRFQRADPSCPHRPFLALPVGACTGAYPGAAGRS